MFIFQKIENQKEVENKARKISMRTSTKINPIYLDYNVFKKSFHDSTKQFFKNLKRDKIVFIGINLWVELKNEEA